MSRKSLFVNALTFSRVPLIVIWAVLAILHELGGALWLSAVACVAMLAAGLTDAFDGALARRWRVVSTLGKMIDPLMDKVFYIVAFPVLVWQIMHQGGGLSLLHGLVMLGFTILYMLRDTWVTFLRSVGALYGADVGAMWLGKVRTALSFPGAGWVYANLAFAPALPDTGRWCALKGYWLMSCFGVEGLLVALTVWSLFTYTAAYAPYLKRALERKENL